MARKIATKETSPWWKSAYDKPYIEVEYEYTVGKHTWKPGDQIKVKNSKLIHVFGHYAKNTQTDTEWLTLCAADGYRSIRQDQIKLPVGRTKR